MKKILILCLSVFLILSSYVYAIGWGSSIAIFQNKETGEYKKNMAIFYRQTTYTSMKIDQYVSNENIGDETVFKKRIIVYKEVCDRDDCKVEGICPVDNLNSLSFVSLEDFSFGEQVVILFQVYSWSRVFWFFLLRLPGMFVFIPFLYLFHVDRKFLVASILYIILYGVINFGNTFVIYFRNILFWGVLVLLGCLIIQLVSFVIGVLLYIKKDAKRDYQTLALWWKQKMGCR